MVSEDSIGSDSNCHYQRLNRLDARDEHYSINNHLFECLDHRQCRLKSDHPRDENKSNDNYSLSIFETKIKSSVSTNE